MTENKNYLVSLSIGPVQDFIAAALRTRDLWFGSYMLSEISKAAAREMNSGLELIFPCVLDEKDLKPGSPLNCANRILGMFTGSEAAAKDLLQAGKMAAKDRLKEFISEAKREAEGKQAEIRDDIWGCQAKPDDLLELYSTGVVMNDDDYTDARNRLDRITAARKNSRDFFQPAQKPDEAPFYGLPKSSLDARRETVLREQDKTKKKQILRKLRMGKREQLDVMGLVKRLAGGTVDQFTPTTRIAIDPWIRKIKGSEQGILLLERISKKIEKLFQCKTGFVTMVSGNKKKYQDMRFDAGVLYSDTLEKAIRDCKNEKKLSKECQILEELRDEEMKNVWKAHGHPCPYYALMLADGDHMGVLLDAAKEKNQHQKISMLLSEFARSVPDTARNHYAHCIYAGGDDVLLMVPLDKALALADTLRKDFHAKLKPIADKLREQTPDLKEPTFSVGLVIAHMQTPVGRVRRLAAEAEKLAKGTETAAPRNALGLIVSPRSGADIRLRIRWEGKQLEKFNELSELYRDEKLPTRFGYELRQITLLLKGITDKEKAVEIKALELKRVLGRKNTGGGQEKLAKETKNAVLAHAQLPDDSSYQPFDQVFTEHLAARWLGVH